MKTHPMLTHCLSAALLTSLSTVATAATPLETVSESVTINSLPVHAMHGADFTSSVATHGDTTYFAYISPNLEACIAKSNGSGTTTAVVFTNVIVDDHHNELSLQVDDDGYIHFTGNMHQNPMVYYRSTNPGDITSWTSYGGNLLQGGVQGAAVSYPSFVKSRRGTLFMLFRARVVNNSDGWLPGGVGGAIARYDLTTKRWTMLGSTNYLFRASSGYDINRARPMVIWDNSGAGLPPANGYQGYKIRVIFDRNNRMHMTWNVAKNPTGTTVSDTHTHVMYAYSDDEGTTWCKVDGTPITLPIGTDNGSVVHSQYPDGHLYNYNTIALTSDNKPIIAQHCYDPAGMLYFRWNGSAWQNVTASWKGDWPGTMATDLNGIISSFGKEYNPAMGQNSPCIYRSNDDGATWQRYFVDIGYAGTVNIDYNYLNATGDLRVHNMPSGGTTAKVVSIDFELGQAPAPYAPSAPVVLTTSLPQGLAGYAYQTKLTARDGAGELSWAVTSGSLPAGLTLQNDGTLVGTPSTAGSSNFTATVVDAQNRTANAALNLVVAADSVGPIRFTQSSDFTSNFNIVTNSGTYDAYNGGVGRRDAASGMGCMYYDTTPYDGATTRNLYSNVTVRADVFMPASTQIGIAFAPQRTNAVSVGLRTDNAIDFYLRTALNTTTVWPTPTSTTLTLIDDVVNNTWYRLEATFITLPDTGVEVRVKLRHTTDGTVALQKTFLVNNVAYAAPGEIGIVGWGNGVYFDNFTILPADAPAAAANSTPTVNTNISASQGATALVQNLAILGGDELNEPRLTYSWFAVAKPAGAQAPSFSLNATNAAKNTTATFSAYGDYVLRCVVSDGEHSVVEEGLLVIEDEGHASIEFASSSEMASRFRLLRDGAANAGWQFGAGVDGAAGYLGITNNGDSGAARYAYDWNGASTGVSTFAQVSVSANVKFNLANNNINLFFAPSITNAIGWNFRVDNSGIYEHPSLRSGLILNNNYSGGTNVNEVYLTTPLTTGVWCYLKADYTIDSSSGSACRVARLRVWNNPEGQGTPLIDRTHTFPAGSYTGVGEVGFSVIGCGANAFHVDNFKVEKID